MHPTEDPGNLKAYAAFDYAAAESLRRQYKAGATFSELVRQTNLAHNVVILILQDKILTKPTPTGTQQMENVTRLHEVIEDLEPLGVQVTKTGTIVLSPKEVLFLTPTDALALADALAELAETI
jgi:hypothetical protein